MRRGRVRLEEKSSDEPPKVEKKLQNRDPRMYRMVPIQPHDHNTRLDYHQRSQIPEKTKVWDLVAWITTFIVVWLVILYFLTADKATDHLLNS